MKVPRFENAIDLANISVMLCDVCRRAIASIRTRKPGSHHGEQPRLFRHASRQDVWTGSHHVEDDSFLDSVQGRCYICYPVLQACPRKSRQHASCFRTFFEIESSGAGRYSMRITIELRQQSPLIEAQVIEMHGKFKILPKNDVPDLDLDRHLPAGTFDIKCQNQVLDWLRTCCQSHATCSEDWRTSINFPMRLLRVSPDQGDRVQLEEYAPGDARPLYVTMSHCWDNFSETLCLTSANLKQLKSGFNGLRLLQKFQDAVAIARWLQVDYLWVDALCIIQDSENDWQQQSRVMGDIYAGSLCNIAATNEGLDSSCFRQRPVDVVEPFCIPDPSRSSESETHVIGYDDFWCNSLLDAKLHTRAWVLQERLLAPRTVHFGKEQIYWECRVSKACEAYPAGIPEQFSNHRTKSWREGEQIFKPKNAIAKQLSSDFISTFAPANGDARIAAQNFWGRTVEFYMACHLTRASDKLVALAGLAHKMQEITNDTYLAGLWLNEYLPQNLLWYVPAAKQTDGRRSIRTAPLGAKHYRAPSWSWASLDGSITWICPARCDQVLIDITNAHATPAHDNPVGAVSSAALVVRGKLIPVRVAVTHRHQDGSSNEDGTYTVTSRMNGTAATNQQIEPLIHLDTNLLPATAAVDAYILPICTQWRGRTGRVIAAVAGLLVRKARFAEEGDTTFERIGVVGLDENEAGVLCAGVGGGDGEGFGAEFTRGEQVGDLVLV